MHNNKGKIQASAGSADAASPVLVPCFSFCIPQ
jgi:hypothetical protein